MTISQLADNSATPPPTDRASERNKKTRDNLSIISRLVAGGGLEPPTSGLWARQANQLLHPAMYLYFRWSFSRFAGAKVRQKNETSKSILKIFQNLYQNTSTAPYKFTIHNNPRLINRQWLGYF